MSRHQASDLKRFNEITARMRELGTIKGDDLQFVLYITQQAVNDQLVYLRPPVSKDRIQRLRHIEFHYGKDMHVKWLLEELKSEWGIDTE